MVKKKKNTSFRLIDQSWILLDLGKDSNATADDDDVNNNDGGIDSLWLVSRIRDSEFSSN